ncbi:MAG: TIGR03936 family radical SAM-associated protein [Christensenellales bacterium]|jgi:radical SAM-linked protein
MRYLVHFSKSGPAAYISHLDIMRTMQRAVRRSGIPARYSQGFNPHPVLSFAAASPVGITSDAQYMDLALDEDADSTKLTLALMKALPQDLMLMRARCVPDAYPKLMAQVHSSEYRIVFDAPGLNDDELLDDFLAQGEILMEKRGKGGVRTVNIRPWILDARVREGKLQAHLAAGSQNNLNPMLFMRAYARFAEASAAGLCHQTQLWAQKNGEKQDLLELDL